MKKSRFVLSGLAVALLGASAAFAGPHMGPRSDWGHRGQPGMYPPPPPPQSRAQFERRIPENAPEDIKAAFKEMRSLRKDLNLELRKSTPDAAKAMEMLKKSEELHMKVREWEVKQVLDGNAPKPGERFRGSAPYNRPGRPGPDGQPGPRFDGRQGRPGCGRPQAPMMWGAMYSFGPMMPHCHCAPMHARRHCCAAPECDVKAPAPQAPVAEAPAGDQK